MSVAKVQEALEKLEALDDLLQDISPAHISQRSWEQSTHEPLKSMRRVLENELIHQEKDALARYMQSNTGLQSDNGVCTPSYHKRLRASGMQSCDRCGKPLAAKA